MRTLLVIGCYFAVTVVEVQFLSASTSSRSVASSCQDNIDTCGVLSKDYCVGPYEPWARENCKRRCACQDKLGTCGLLQKSFYCVGSYEAWARDNCEQTCGYCQDHATTATPVSSATRSIVAHTTTLPTTKLPSTSLVTTTLRSTTLPLISIACQDEYNDCGVLQSSHFCVGASEAWVRKNCKQTCGYCQDHTITATPVPRTPPSTVAHTTTVHVPATRLPSTTLLHVPTTLPSTVLPSTSIACQDKITNCDIFSRTFCVAPYEGWARENCNQTCGFCQDHTTTATPFSSTSRSIPAHTTTLPATTLPLASIACQDKIGDCDLVVYSKTFCVGQYEAWAREHCKQTCSYCQATAAVQSKPPTQPNLLGR